MDEPNEEKMDIKDEKDPAAVTPQRTGKVIKGHVKKKKQGWLDSVAQTFFGDSAKSVGNYVWWDVLIPAAKDTVRDMVSTGIEMLLFGETKGSNVRRGDKGRSIVSYSSYYGRGREREREERPGIPRRSSSSRVEDIVIDTRGEAEDVLGTMVDLVEDYGQARVSDFYDAVDLEAEWTDQKWGWTNLSRAVVRRVRDGYIIEFPRPQQLD